MRSGSVVRRVGGILLGVAAGAAVTWAVLLLTRAPTVLPTPQALEEAWERVREHPRSAGAWLRLGDVQAELQDPIAAEHAYATAVRVADGSPGPFARLGFHLYSQGRDEEALVRLRQAQRLGSDEELVRFTIASLERQVEREHPSAPAPEPSTRRAPAPQPAAAPNRSEAAPARAPAPAPEVVAEVEAKPEAEPEEDAPVLGDCEVPFTRSPHGRGVLVTVVVDGVEGTLLFDTGASTTVLTEEFAETAELQVEPDSTFHAITAGGRTEFRAAIAEEISFAGRTVEGNRVALCEDCFEEIADGLLGLDLQAVLGLQLDLASGTIRFADCE